MLDPARIRDIRKSPLCIAAATCISVVGISTAFFFAAWRLGIDAHQYFLGVPMDAFGAWVLVRIMFLVVLPVIVAVLGICLDRCVVWWQGVLTFFAAVLFTFYLISTPTARFLLPISLLGEGSRSSARWYLGAILQLVAAFFLLRYFPRPPRVRQVETKGV